jgi:hypothetical protein
MHFKQCILCKQLIRSMSLVHFFAQNAYPALLPAKSQTKNGNITIHTISLMIDDTQPNIRMINQGSSEINIIVGVENQDFEKAVCSIYEEFVE